MSQDVKSCMDPSTQYLFYLVFALHCSPFALVTYSPRNYSINSYLYLAPILLSLWFKATCNYITYNTYTHYIIVQRWSETVSQTSDAFLYGNWMCFFNVIDTYYTWEKRELTCHRKLSNRMKWNQLIKTYIRTEQNKLYFKRVHST